MKVLSLFSGVGGFDLALERAGMTVVAQAESDPYCRKVLARHWPEVPRYEDVRDVGVPLAGEHRRDRVGARAGSVEQHPYAGVDLICGGFPCQDVSVAGRRAGLDGERSGLWFEFQRILRELRPRWALIENVPGLLSSNGGRDFAVILDGLGECGFGGIAWAVLNSEHFGVAQRRRRVFIVGGPTRRSAEQVLALCESCGGHPQTGRAAREDVTAEAGDGVANPLGAKADGGWRGDLDNDTFVANTIDANIGTKQWLGDQNVEDFLPVMDALAVRTAQTSANGHGVSEGVAHTLDGTQGQAVAVPLRSNRWGGSDSHGTSRQGASGERASRRRVPGN